ncbi:MAG: hypothetical protein SFU53_06330 [Terrimicrobiaceae bacterium]|nr:hypothetical protein [Terrimicrobiaceae bacterium]
MSQLTVNLGNEYDAQLWIRLKLVIKKLGGQMSADNWGLSGSQELETFKVAIDGQILNIQSETYIGITLSGDSALVEKIQRLVDQERGTKEPTGQRNSQP